MQLSKNVLITCVKDTEAEAGTEVVSDSVDMAGWDGVLFMAAIAKFNAGNYMSVEQCDDDSTFLALAGTKVAAVANAEVVGVDIYRPTDRYLHASIIRAGLATATGEIYAIQYRGRKAPVTNVVANEINIEAHVSPAEGTI